MSAQRRSVQRLFTALVLQSVATLGVWNLSPLYTFPYCVPPKWGELARRHYERRYCIWQRSMCSVIEYAASSKQLGHITSVSFMQLYLHMLTHILHCLLTTNRDSHITDRLRSAQYVRCVMCEQPVLKLIYPSALSQSTVAFLYYVLLI